ncbi:PREDICTED: neuroligin-1-like [Priapulus caudatus]|uniref:Neuroligin-1-like n=1 Tax=Priapulus caudatus TaxID=37621 RepID=A0ABM1EU35_PRICU|nr:PREDICTED: neuroligin-1-like [Priapulus caudatus]
MVFIHGESYEWNSGNPYDGSVLASVGKVIVITINFRLGILGFLSTGESSWEQTATARGNYGLLDQIAALHWVKENIERFGGDPDNVTIFGHGYGAACVNLLMLSPFTERLRLFHRAIMMSGSALSSWAMVENPKQYAVRVARELDCYPRGADGKPAIDMQCLRRKPVEAYMRIDIEAPTYLTAFGPAVDGITVKKDPLHLMTWENSRFGMYDLLFGVAKEEAYNFFNANDTRSGIDDRRRSGLLRTFVRNLFVYHQNELYWSVMNEYTDWEKPFQHPQTLRGSLLEAFGDSQFVAPVVEAGNLHTYVHIDTYFYVFSYQTRRGDVGDDVGCIHGDELQYVFGAPIVGGSGLRHFVGNYSRQEKLLSESVITYWTNFASTG